MYRSLVKSAKSEDSLEYKELEEGEVVPTKARRELIDYLSTLSGIHLKIGEKATELIVNTLYLYPDMANKGILKFLILNASREGGYGSAMEMTEELLSALKETKYERADVYNGDSLMINEEFDKMINALEKFVDKDEEYR